MHYILWYNILSIHQTAFVKALAALERVTVVAENALDEDCLHEQNAIPNMGMANVIVAPDTDKINELMHSDDAIHFVCGLDFAFRKYNLVKKLIQVNAKILCYCEPYVWNDGKGLLRRIKYWLLYLRFGHKIPGILYMGENGYRCMRQSGFRKEQLFAWGYFTEISETIDKKKNEDDGLVHFIFAGRLDENKNCRLLLETMHEMKEDFRLTIVGDGRSRPAMEHYWQEDKRIKWLGLLPNDKTQELIGRHDVLVLPSKYDGWGAVINEALMHGTRVICSENCGAATLISNKSRGEVFSLNIKKGLEEAIKNQIKIGKQIAIMRISLMTWSLENISGKAVAKYFISINKYLFNNQEFPNVPWEK